MEVKIVLGENEKYAESKFILYKDESAKHFSSQILPNLEVDLKRKILDDLNETKVVVSIYETEEECDECLSRDVENFLGKFALILEQDKTQNSFDIFLPDNLVSIKLSKNY